ncbi:MAG: hypothetical protein NXH83_13785 [Rhodobacteraceae bacterium]|nr:hypothetical protein [Paracoccaceae bacterium]
MSAAQCRFFAKLAQAVCRLNIDPAKTDFLRLRLSRRIRALGLEEFDSYVDLLRSDPEGPEIRKFIEALTTHTTAFFRERHQYDWLDREGLAILGETGAGFDRPLTVWSAACSSGVELWSAAMLLAEAASRPGGLRRFELVGTDISHAILRKATAATYTEEETAGLADGFRVRYLMRSRAVFEDSRGHLYRIVPELRAKARFSACNLTDATSLPGLSADVVFLRNVLIYFEAAVQAQVIESVAERLRPGGILFTGHAEAVPVHPRLRSIGPSIYRKE